MVDSGHSGSSVEVISTVLRIAALHITEEIQ